MKKHAITTIMLLLTLTCSCLSACSYTPDPKPAPQITEAAEALTVEKPEPVKPEPEAAKPEPQPVKPEPEAAKTDRPVTDIYDENGDIDEEREREYIRYIVEEKPSEIAIWLDMLGIIESPQVKEVTELLEADRKTAEAIVLVVKSISIAYNEKNGETFLEDSEKLQNLVDELLEKGGK